MADRLRLALTLPPYPVLDAILAGLVEPGQSAETLVAAGQDRAIVQRVWRRLDRAEYNRRQASPGPRIWLRPLGRDRRTPITNGYTGLIS
jgi:NAD+ synthase